MHTVAKPKRSPTIKYTASRANSQRGSTDLSKRSYPPVESIQRALTVLRAVNHFRIATVNDINFATKYPKSSIVRVLETLVGEGYVARDNLCGGYRVTSKAAELHAGHQGISSLIECARPCAVELTNEIKWPVNIGLLVEDSIVIQFSTAPISPLADVQMLGQRLDLFSTAMGRVYLAFCGGEEREALIARRFTPGPIDAKEDEWRLRTILPMVRDEGFALGVASSLDRTIALPIFRADHLAAVVSLEYYDSVVPRAEIRDRLVAPLRNAARSVEATMAEADCLNSPPSRGNLARGKQDDFHHDNVRSCGRLEAPRRPLPDLPSYADARNVRELNAWAK